MLTDEEIIRAGYMHTVEADEPLFTFNRPELLAMVRELLAAHSAKSHGAWKLAVDHELVTIGSTADSFDSPKAAIAALIDWHVSAALDPAISKSAQDLIDKGRVSARAQEPIGEWRCFHCDEVFADEAPAAEHFGTSQHQEPACQIDITKYREMEETVRRYNEEDTDLHREIHRLHASHQRELQGEEEKGYARGLADAVKYPSDAHPQPMKDAARDVLAERRRQVEVEGWTTAHDDGANDVAAMADAAACYAMHAGQMLARAYSTPCLQPHSLWPWDASWWKPTTPRRDLVKAGALILAEIERIDRIAEIERIEREGEA